MNHINRVLAAEISAISKYYDRLVQWCPAKHDQLHLFENIESPSKEIIDDFESLNHFLNKPDERIVVLLNGTIDYAQDIQSLLSMLHGALTRASRLILIVYNPYFKWIYQIANLFGWRKGELPASFVTRTSIQNLAKLAGFEIVKTRTAAYSPFNCFGLGNIVDAILPCIPLIKWFSFAAILVLRPVVSSTTKPSLSIVVPARNEKGNIDHVIAELHKLQGIDFEVIFVEGHSDDGTWEEIVRISSLANKQFKLRTLRQNGIGKADAIRLGFAHASHDLLTILDADLSISPECLKRLYDAYCQGFGDFVNGNRLVYTMESGAMSFINKLGNIFFAKALSLTLGVPLGDTLCGTKLFQKSDYQRFVQWRKDFGDFDPFGDFELLFPAAILGLGIVDVPIKYKERIYGTTKIKRFRHGLILLKMTLIGFFKISLGRT